MTPSEITAHFHKKIPLSQALGIKVIEVSSRHARVDVPLSPNINHVQTAFGGSIYAVAALSCYALFQVLAKEAGGLSDELVIQEGKIRYLAPINGDFTVESRMADQEDGHKFIETLKRHGKARLLLKAEVICNGTVGAVFEGIYVYSGRFLSTIKS